MVILQKKVVEKLKEEHVVVSKRHVNRLFNKFRLEGKISINYKTGKKTYLENKHFDFIDDEYENSDELTAVDLQRKLKEKFKLVISVSSVKEIRRKLGWIKPGPRYCQIVRSANQIERLIFAAGLVSTKRNI